MVHQRTRGDIFICIRSRDLQLTGQDGYNNAGRLNLFQNIEAEDNEILAVRLQSATIPNSFYNLSNNNQNNKIYFKETGDASYKEITIPSGSYDILELTSDIKTLLESNSTNTLTYTFTYDEIDNSLTIKNNNPTLYNTSFDFTQNNSCRRFLGFTNNIFTINSTDGITSDRTIDITDTRNSIYLRLPNLNNSKVIESNSGKYSNVIAQIPVALSRNTFFVYEPPSEFICMLSQKNINSIDVNITYQDETEAVNFERGDWEINLIISFFEKHEDKKKHLHSLDREIINRIENMYNRSITEQQEQEELTEFINNKMNELKNKNI